MQVRLDTRPPQHTKADALLILTDKDWKASLPPFLDPTLRATVRAELGYHGFTAKDGESVLVQTHATTPWRYVVLLGSGDSSSPRTWYSLAQLISTKLRDLKARRSLLWLPEEELSPRHVAILVEGTELSAYRFEQFKSNPRPAKNTVLSILCTRASAELRAACAEGTSVAKATCLARDLVQTPAAVATPQYLADHARRIARAQRLQARILDGAAIRRAGMGALLGVAQGSALPPRFIELVYRPRRKPTRIVALVGKGITFDTGGLSLKPADSMQSQKRDMAGGAAVLGAMSTLRDLDIHAEVRAYVPCAENMPSGTAIRPGDVLRAFNGKTIEVLNTDAEGRLVLADALAYAAQRKPDVIIDLATLTAAVRIALGTRYAGIMGNRSELVRAIIDAGKECGENFWELPLVDDYRGDIDSQIADLKNTGEASTGAGTIIGGLFLREFVGDIPWCHIDFSSTVMADKPFACHPRGATGFGVRTLLRFLRNVGAEQA